jgi:isopenicillin N synthase-like dioxygenase
MHGPNVWPSQLPGWQQQVQHYFASMLQLSRVVARGLALSLGLPEKFFTEKMQDPVAQLLLLRYPPPPNITSSESQPAAAEQQHQAVTGEAAVEGQQQQQQQQRRQHVGCGTHTDCGFMTILAQVGCSLWLGSKVSRH